MLGSDALVRLRGEGRLALAIVYDERPIAADPRDTVSSALLRAGVVATSRSLKFRRPRGPYCLRGDCGTCLVRIDGVPNLRACTTAVRDGMIVKPQNRVLERGPDPTALVDKMFGAGMDHHHLMLRPRLVNQVMQEVARNLAGLGTLPDAPPAAPTRHEHHACDVLIVGGGAAGRAAAQPLMHAGLVVEHVERFDRRQLASAPTTPLRCDTAVFGIYPAEQRDGGRVAAIERSAAGTVLHTFAPRHLVLATGARDPMLPLHDNDLPGVLAARGLLALLRRIDGDLAVPAVVVGAGAGAHAIAAALGAELVAEHEVTAVLGSGRVEAIATARGKLDAGVVAIAAAPAPASELARHTGARVRYDGNGFPIVRDAEGRCAEAGWTAWACGEVAGSSAQAAADDGARVAAGVLADVREENRA
jgi:sarcosine oxidase, subunit alpha